MGKKYLFSFVIVIRGDLAGEMRWGWSSGPCIEPLLEDVQQLRQLVVLGLLLLVHVEVAPPVVGVEAPMAGAVLQVSVSVTHELLRGVHPLAL